jgi:hypothetical protein
MLPIAIYLTDIEQVSLAVEWCQESIEKNQWKFSSNWPGPKYCFKFFEEKSAILFVLKWL